MTREALARCRVWWRTRAPRGAFWMYFAGAVFFNFAFSLYFFLFNIYLVGRGFDERSLGIIGSLMAFGGLCGTIPVGVLAERLGLRWTLASGVALTCVVALLQVTILSVPAQNFLAVLSGLALCSWGICLAPAVAALTTEQQRPAAFSLTFASGIGVGVLGGLAAGYLPVAVRAAARMPLSNVQVARIVLIFACGVGLLAILPISQIRVQSYVPRKRLVRISTPFLREFLLAMAVWGLVTGALPPFANVYFVHHLGLSLKGMGSLFSLSQLVQVGAILLAPLVFRRLGLANGIMLTQMTTAGMLFLLAFAHTYTHAAWLYCAYMAAQYMNEPGLYSLLMDRVDSSERTGVSSYTSLIGSLSRMLASTVMGYSIVHVGYSAALGGIAVLAVVAALLFRRLVNKAPVRGGAALELSDAANVTSLSQT